MAHTIFDLIEELQQQMNTMRYDHAITVADFSSMLRRAAEELQHKENEQRRLKLIQRVGELQTDPAFWEWSENVRMLLGTKDVVLRHKDMPEMARLYDLKLSPKEAFERFIEILEDF